LFTLLKGGLTGRNIVIHRISAAENLLLKTKAQDDMA